jgi:predicted ATP-dependent serine protease
MQVVAREIVSREDELASIHAFIGRTEIAPSALVLEGEPGIGKSTLWLAGVEHARVLGATPLPASPTLAR